MTKTTLKMCLTLTAIVTFHLPTICVFAAPQASQTAASKSANDVQVEIESADSPIASQRVPGWAKDAVFYQIFPERFRNGDPNNDPTHESLEFPDITPKSWKVTPWTSDWYQRADWEKKMGDNFYEDGVFHRRFGGDLQGVIDKLDYLADLGINTIYFNPVFYARSLHKYDGNSFHHIDPHFGPDPTGDFALLKTETADPKTWHWTKADQLFLSLIKQAHKRNIRVIIDGVFNHTGRDFFAFADIAKNQKDSTYLDWYTVKEFDNPETNDNEFKYDCWWGVDTLPVFADNADGTDLHPKPRAYIFQSTMRWMDPNGDGNPIDGIDGWRLDVANEVPNKFWREWNSKIRELNPEALTVAEFWDEAGDYLADCGFSSTMNYHGFAYPAKGFLIDSMLPASDFGKMLADRMTTHPREVRLGLQNLIDSHDVNRLSSMIVNADKKLPYKRADRFDYDNGERVSPRHFRECDVSRPTKRHFQILRLTALFQMSFVGAPMIYYGTECGMDGADDPDDRMPMVWDDLKYEPRKQGPYGPLEKSEAIEFDHDLFDFYKQLIKTRKQHAALRQGSFQVVATDDDQKTIVFERKTDSETLLIALNRGSKTASIQLPKQYSSTDFRLKPIQSSTDKTATAAIEGANFALSLPPLSGQIWQVTPMTVTHQ